MRRFIYVDKDGFIEAVNDSTKKLSGENIIEAPFDFDLTNKRWNGKAWEDYKPAPSPQQPTDAQIAQAKLDYLMMMQETL